MRIINLALKDLLQIVRDWKAAFFLIIMPIAFTLLFGFAFGGQGDAGDPRLPVGFLDQDQGPLGPLLVQLLDSSEVLRVDDAEATKDELARRVGDEELAAAVIIPEGYSQLMLAGGVMPLKIIVDDNMNAGMAIQGEIQTAALRLASAALAARISAEVYEQQIGFSSIQERDVYLQKVSTRGISLWEKPPVTVSRNKAGSSQEEGLNERTKEENGFTHSSPGMTAQFAIAGLMGAAAVLVLERKNGALQRLLTTPITRLEILIGHFLAMFIMVLVQLLILVSFGHLLLNLDYFDRPLATLLLVVMTALFVASLGLLIGALARSEEQVIVFALIPMFVLAGLGGAWVTLEITPEGFQKIASFTPIYWVITGFKDIIIRGRGLEAVLSGAMVLLIYTILLFALAAWRFRYE